MKDAPNRQLEPVEPVDTIELNGVLQSHLKRSSLNRMP